MVASDSSDEAVSTRVVTNQQLVHDGVTFTWGAVGDDPALVTISNSIFGSLREFTRDDPKAFALTLAERLLHNHHAQAEQTRKTDGKSEGGSSASFTKAGWFERR